MKRHRRLHSRENLPRRQKFLAQNRFFCYQKYFLYHLLGILFLQMACFSSLSSKKPDISPLTPWFRTPHNGAFSTLSLDYESSRRDRDKRLTSTSRTYDSTFLPLHVTFLILKNHSLKAEIKSINILFYTFFRSYSWHYDRI